MLYYIEIQGERFGYKLLTRRQLREALDNADEGSLDFEDEVCRACVVETPDTFPGWDDCLAGIPTALCEDIMMSSGYVREVTDPSSGRIKRFIPEVEMQAIQWAQTAQARLDTLIVFCFPKYSYEDLEDMDPEEYYKCAAGSQLIIGGVYGMDASVFLDPSRDGRPAPQQGAAPPPSQGHGQSKYAVQ